MWFMCLSVSLDCSFVLLILITDTIGHNSMCFQTCTTLEGCQVWVTWQEILINVSKPAAANLPFKSESHCNSIISNWMWTGRAEVFTVNGEQKTLKSFSSSVNIWKCWSNSSNSPVNLSYVPLHHCGMLGRVHIFQTRKVSSSITTRDFCFPKWQLQLDCTYALIIQHDNFVAPLQYSHLFCGLKF